MSKYIIFRGCRGYWGIDFVMGFRNMLVGLYNGCVWYYFGSFFFWISCCIFSLRCEKMCYFSEKENCGLDIIMEKVNREV